MAPIHAQTLAGEKAAHLKSFEENKVIVDGKKAQVIDTVLDAVLDTIRDEKNNARQGHGHHQL